MKKTVLLSAIIMAIGMCLNAQTLVFEDNFESYPKDSAVAKFGGYVQWEGTSVVDSVEGNKFAKNVNVKSLRKEFPALTVGQTYTWFVKTKVDDTGDVWLGVNPGNIGGGLSVYNEEWELHRYVFTVPDNDNNGKIILCINAKNYTCYIDDIQLYEGDVDTPTAINEVVANTVKVAPNPTEGIFTLTDQEAISSYKVFNSVGQLVQERSVLSVKEVSVDLSQEKKGLYMLQVTDESGTTQTSKLIIK